MKSVLSDLTSLCSPLLKVAFVTVAFLLVAGFLFIEAPRAAMHMINNPACDICPAGTCDDHDLPHAPNPPNETGLTANN